MDYGYAGLLLREVARLFLQSQQETLGCCGPTTPSECKLMTELGPTDALTVADLARRLAVDKGWVSRVADGLSLQGLVEKVPGETDRRTVLIRLSADGKGRLEALNGALSAHAAGLLSRVPAEKQPMLIEALELLHDCVHRRCCEPNLVTLEDEP